MRHGMVVIDIGNTCATLGWYSRRNVTRVARVPTVVTDKTAIRRALRSVSRDHLPDAVGLASVVPKATSAWRKAIGGLWSGVPLLEIGWKLKLGVKLNYPRPWTIGADRLCNACAAVDKYGAPVIVVDFGTAVTFDVISPQREYIGGVIAPGIELMFSYLAERTALLPRIGWGRCRHVVGRSTREAMRLGAQWGYRGMVEAILQELISGLRWDNVTICATGGYAHKLLRTWRWDLRLDPTLTLYGVGRICELNLSL